MHYWLNVQESMGLSKNYKQRRKHPYRLYKKNYHLSFEGHKTECQYFSCLREILRDTRSDCARGLKKYCPTYNKDIDWIKYKDKIKIAITRAKELDYLPVIDWPRKNGTTVYRLVTKLTES